MRNCCCSPMLLLQSREKTISTFLEIQQYDMALKAGREAQRILRDLGSQMLAFSENEIAACNGIATFGLMPLRQAAA